MTGGATTALEEVAFGLEQAAVPHDEIESRAREYLERVGISTLVDREPQTLSGGQLQRLAIASVLALEPDMLVLDEPTSQLDPAGTDDVFSLATDMNEEGYTIVFVSQDLQRLAPRVDRLLVFDDGKLRYDDDPRTVFAVLEAADDTDLLAIPETFCIGRAFAEHDLFDGELPLTVSELSEGARMSDIELTSARANGGAVSSSFSPPQSNRALGSDEPSPIVDGQDVSYTYTDGTEALRDATLRMETGCIAIVGHNGAGKTTLAKHLNGLCTPTTGSVRIAGRDTREGHVATFAQHVGLCFQNPDDQLFRSTVESEVRFGPEQLGYEQARIDELVSDALATLDLDAIRDANVYDLGRTLRQRVAIASVIAMDTPAVVLDEPTGGQDARGIAVMSQVMDDLTTSGRLVVLITHDIDFAAKHADRVVVLDGGEIVADGPPTVVFGSERAILDRAGVVPPVATRTGVALGLNEGILSIEGLLSIVDELD